MDASVVKKWIFLFLLPLFSYAQVLLPDAGVELADPYVTVLKDSVLVSGTAQYYVKFPSLAELAKGGKHEIVWQDFFYSDGKPMEGGRLGAHSWDLKPALWSRSKDVNPRLWNPDTDKEPPLVVWYGGHMRPQPGHEASRWPEDNFSRDIFAFTENSNGRWFSAPDSIFSSRGHWPRGRHNYLGHRYGHHIVMVPKASGKSQTHVAAVFYEEVTAINDDGSPRITKIFMDEMETPFQVRGKPVELISPANPATGTFYPSTVRENGSALVEGPLYFRFNHEGEDWEAIGFSAGSYYGKYPSSFAARKIADGLAGKPYQLDLNNDGTDLNDAGSKLGKELKLRGGPGRPAVIVNHEGKAMPGPFGMLQVLFHGYRPQEVIRKAYYAFLKIENGLRGSLRFEIAGTQRVEPDLQKRASRELAPEDTNPSI